LVAIYHSHPAGPLRPSKRDVERSHYPDSAYLIVSLEDPERPETAAFRIIGSEVLDIEVHVIV
jgi:proteasome lid subunit RPN8/RPN11